MLARIAKHTGLPHKISNVAAASVPKPTAVSKPSSSKTSQTDWPRVDALRDEDIDLSDIPELTPEMFEHAVVCAGRQAVRPKLEVMLQLDADVIEWFKTLSPDYQDRINALLRAYMEAQRRPR